MGGRWEGENGFSSMNKKKITAEAERALAEAEARRKMNKEQSLRPEKGGPKGPEPTRFGDWEKKGITSDF